jgi:hypothetical protein
LDFGYQIKRSMPLGEFDKAFLNLPTSLTQRSLIIEDFKTTAMPPILLKRPAAHRLRRFHGSLWSVGEHTSEFPLDKK